MVCIRFIGAKYFPEDNQDKSKHARAMVNSCNKPSICNNFLNLFLEQNFTCFGQFLCPSSGVFYCTHSSGICHTGLLALSENLYDIHHCCVYREKLLMMDRGTVRNM